MKIRRSSRISRPTLKKLEAAKAQKKLPKKRVRVFVPSKKVKSKSAEQKKAGDSSSDELKDGSPIIHSHSSEIQPRHIQERSGDDSTAT